MRQSTVWMVPLQRGAMAEVQGTISLEARTLVFTGGSDGERRTIPLRAVRVARRVRGSPVLLVVYQEEDRTRRTAFYFAQPPPLEPERPTVRDVPGFGGVLGGRRGGPRATKRKVARGNMGYLTRTNAGKKHEIKAWVRAIREGMSG